MFGKKKNETNEEKVAKYKEKGKKALDKGKFKDAITVAEKGLAVDEEEAEFYLLRASAYYKLKNVAKAIEDCRACLDLDSGEADAWALLGQAYLDQRSLGKAYQALERALEAEPGNERAQAAMKTLQKDPKYGELMTRIQLSKIDSGDAPSTQGSGQAELVKVISGKPFGLTLKGNVVTGVTEGKGIYHYNNKAAKADRVEAGDVIVQIGAQNIEQFSATQLTELLKACPDPCQLLIRKASLVPPGRDRSRTNFDLSPGPEKRKRGEKENEPDTCAQCQKSKWEWECVECALTLCGGCDLAHHRSLPPGQTAHNRTNPNTGRTRPPKSARESMLQLGADQSVVKRDSSMAETVGKGAYSRARAASHDKERDRSSSKDKDRARGPSRGFKDTDGDLPEIPEDRDHPPPPHQPVQTVTAPLPTQQRGGASDSSDDDDSDSDADMPLPTPPPSAPADKEEKEDEDGTPPPPPPPDEPEPAPPTKAKTAAGKKGQTKNKHRASESRDSSSSSDSEQEVKKARAPRKKMQDLERHERASAAKQVLSHFEDFDDDSHDKHGGGSSGKKFNRESWMAEMLNTGPESEQRGRAATAARNNVLGISPSPGARESFMGRKSPVQGNRDGDDDAPELSRGGLEENKTYKDLSVSVTCEEKSVKSEKIKSVKGDKGASWPADTLLTLKVNDPKSSKVTFLLLEGKNQIGRLRMPCVKLAEYGTVEKRAYPFGPSKAGKDHGLRDLRLKHPRFVSLYTTLQVGRYNELLLRTLWLH
eukprot:g45440.t1